MSESFITVSTEYVVKMAREQLAKVQDKAKNDFNDYIDGLVTRANLQIQIRHDKCEARKKSILRFLMPKSWVTCPPFRYAEDVREQILAEFTSVEHPAYRFDFDEPELIAAVVDDPSVTWPTLWKLANINTRGIKHGNKIHDIKDAEATMQLSLTHARLICLIF